MVVNGNEVAICGMAGHTQWPNLDYQAPNSGLHPYIARFNKNTGAIIALNALNSTGGSDIGTALATDSKGNYYMGGSFEAALTVGPSTLNNSGNQTDFFIAKFGSTDCTFLATTEPEKMDLKAYPNPVKSILHIENSEKSSYVLYDVLGAAVQSGTVVPMGSINLEGLAKGLYMLHLRNEDGEVEVVKVEKE